MGLSAISAIHTARCAKFRQACHIRISYRTSSAFPSKAKPRSAINNLSLYIDVNWQVITERRAQQQQQQQQPREKKNMDARRGSLMEIVGVAECFSWYILIRNEFYLLVSFAL
jgi:hypothetical protein